MLPSSLHHSPLCSGCTEAKQSQDRCFRTSEEWAHFSVIPDNRDFILAILLSTNHPWSPEPSWASVLREETDAQGQSKVLTNRKEKNSSYSCFRNQLVVGDLFCPCFQQQAPWELSSEEHLTSQRLWSVWLPHWATALTAGTHGTHLNLLWRMFLQTMLGFFPFNVLFCYNFRHRKVVRIWQRFVTHIPQMLTSTTFVLYTHTHFLPELFESLLQQTWPTPSILPRTFLILHGKSCLLWLQANWDNWSP